MCILQSTYLAKTKHLEDDVFKIYVCRYLPKGFKIPDNSDHMIELSPDPVMFDQYKKGVLDFKTFIGMYEQKLKMDLINGKIDLSKITSHKKVCFICYEKDPIECHRSVACRVISSFCKVIEYRGEFNVSIN